MSDVVKSAKRVLQIFEFFAERRSKANVNDVCKALGYPQSSASMLLHSLTKLGYMTYDAEARAFHPTIRIALLGSWLVDQEAGDLNLLGLMQELSRETGDAIVLGVANDLHVLYIHVVQATNAVRLYMKPGSLRPIAITAVGRALLSMRPDAEVKKIIRRLNAERAEDAPLLDGAEIGAAVTKARKLGYAFTDSIATPGAAVVARPLPTLPDQPAMAIGIGFASAHAPDKEQAYAKLLEKAIARLNVSGLSLG